MAANPARNAEKNNQTPSRFAEEARKEHEALKLKRNQEDLTTVPGDEVANEAGKQSNDAAFNELGKRSGFWNKQVDQFNKDSGAVKALKVGTLVVGGYFGVKLLFKGIKAVVNGVTKLTGNIIEKITGLRSKETEKILAAILTPVLGVAGLSIVYKMLKDKGMESGDLLAIYKKDGMKGIGAFIVDGAKDLGSDSYEVIRKLLLKVGIPLPAFAALAALKKGKEKLGDAKDKLKELKENVKKKDGKEEEGNVDENKEGYMTVAEIEDKLARSIKRDLGPCIHHIKDNPVLSGMIANQLGIVDLSVGLAKMGTAQAIGLMKILLDLGIIKSTVGLGVLYVLFKKAKEKGGKAQIPVTVEAITKSLEESGHDESVESIHKASDFMQGKIPMEDMMNVSMSEALSEYAQTAWNELFSPTDKGEVMRANREGMDYLFSILRVGRLDKDTDQLNEVQNKILKRWLDEYRLNKDSEKLIHMTGKDIADIKAVCKNIGIEITINQDEELWKWEAKDKKGSDIGNGALGIVSTLSSAHYKSIARSFTPSDSKGEYLDSFKELYRSGFEFSGDVVEVGSDTINIVKSIAKGEFFIAMKGGYALVSDGIEGGKRFLFHASDFTDALTSFEGAETVSLYSAWVGPMFVMGATKDILIGRPAKLIPRMGKALVSPIRLGQGILKYRFMKAQYNHQVELFKTYGKRLSIPGAKKFGAEKWSKMVTDLQESHKLSDDLHERLHRLKGKILGERHKHVNMGKFNEDDFKRVLGGAKVNLKGGIDEDLAKEVFGKSGFKNLSATMKKSLRDIDGDNFIENLFSSNKANGLSKTEMQRLLYYTKLHAKTLDGEMKVTRVMKLHTYIDRLAPGKATKIVQSMDGAMTKFVQNAPKAIAPAALALMIYDQYNNKDRPSKDVIAEHAIGWALMGNMKAATYNFKKSLTGGKLTKEAIKGPKAIVKYLGKVGLLAVLEIAGIQALDVEKRAEEMLGAGEFNSAIWGEINDAVRDFETFTGAKLGIAWAGKIAKGKIVEGAVRGIASTSPALFAKALSRRIGARVGKILGKRITTTIVAAAGLKAPLKLIPVVGWAWLAYDVGSIGFMVKKANDVKDASTSQAEKDMKQIKLDKDGENIFKDKCESLGGVWGDLSEEDQQQFILQNYEELQPELENKSTLTFERTDGSWEKYTYKAGEVQHVEIFDGTETLELDEDDLGGIEWDKVAFDKGDGISEQKYKAMLASEDPVGAATLVYAMEILRYKEVTNFRQIDKEIKDAKTIEMKRHDLDGAITMKLNDSYEWDIYDGDTKLAHGMDFYQAMGLANLTLYSFARVKEYNQSDDWQSEDGTKRPFIHNDDEIIYQKDGFDKDFIQKQIPLYKDNLGLTMGQMVESLNGYFGNHASKHDLLGN